MMIINILSVFVLSKLLIRVLIWSIGFENVAWQGSGPLALTWIRTGMNMYYFIIHDDGAVREIGERVRYRWALDRDNSKC